MPEYRVRGWLYNVAPTSDALKATARDLEAAGAVAPTLDVHEDVVRATFYVDAARETDAKKAADRLLRHVGGATFGWSVSEVLPSDPRRSSTTS